MLQKPLHHCYLVEADSLENCLSNLSTELKQLHSSQDHLFIDGEVVETLTIEMARALRARGQQKAAGEHQCIIRGFDIATVEAQNALLKIIEAPATGVHFFLVTPQPDQLLETIRSRAWRLEGVCGQVSTETGNPITEEFLSAESLPARLKAVEKLATKHDLRVFTAALADTELPHKNPEFGRALEQVADWGRDSGGSIKLLRQYLAVALSHSVGGK